jgi:hypothetical protein
MGAAGALAQRGDEFVDASIGTPVASRFPLQGQHFRQPVSLERKVIEPRNWFLQPRERLIETASAGTRK